jgi:hypothetical protein
MMQANTSHFRRYCANWLVTDYEEKDRDANLGAFTCWVQGSPATPNDVVQGLLLDTGHLFKMIRLQA